MSISFRREFIQQRMSDTMSALVEIDSALNCSDRSTIRSGGSGDAAVPGALRVLPEGSYVGTRHRTIPLLLGAPIGRLRLHFGTVAVKC